MAIHRSRYPRETISLEINQTNPKAAELLWFFSDLLEKRPHRPAGRRRYIRGSATRPRAATGTDGMALHRESYPRGTTKSRKNQTNPTPAAFLGFSWLRATNEAAAPAVRRMRGHVSGIDQATSRPGARLSVNHQERRKTWLGDLDLNQDCSVQSREFYR